MTEEFDEDVVFENSPLFQYLQDLGHTDFEACPTVSQEEERAGGEGDPSPQDIPTPPRGGCFRTLVEAMWRRGPFYQGSMAEQQLDAEFGQYSLRCVLEQEVLLQEDVELIELLDPSLLSVGVPSQPTALPGPRFLANPSLWDMAVLVGLVAVLLGLRSVFDAPVMCVLAPWTLVLLSLVVLRGSVLWRTARLQRSVRTQALELEQLVLNSKALTNLARKSLRLVQETEVISRGFTLVSVPYPFSRAGPGPRGQQLLGLRKAAYRALRSAFRASRLATCHMLKSYPLDSEIDNVTNYVSTVPLKELGLGLGPEHLSDEEVQELTDDYSLPALKVLFQLWVGQSSEFFRRLALLLSPGRRDGAAHLGHHAAATVTGPLHRTLAGCLGDLQRSFDFHRYFEMQQQAQGSERVGRARQKCRELNALHASVRSLQLHLKALLSEVIILEDELEKLMVSHESAEATHVGYQELRDRLRLLQPHVQASTACWDDAVGQVDRMLRRAADCPATPDTPEECVPAVPLAPPRPITHIQDRDPIPEEQELEAYASDSDSDEEWHGSFPDALSPAERERRQREREESGRVLMELKSVLGLRASEVERRKWKQLLFSDQAALTPTLSLVTSEPPAPSSLGCPSAQAQPEGNHVTGPTKQEEEEGKGEGPIEKPLLPEIGREVQTEFSCGQAEGEGSGADTSEPSEGTRDFHYDGVPDEEAGPEDWDRLPGRRVPLLSVTDRLTELHGSAALSFSSALAVQAAARSHAFAHLEEQMFGEEEEEEVTSQPRGKSPERN